MTEDSDRSFFKDDSDSLFDDGACSKDDASVTDSESPGTEHDFMAVSRLHIVFAIPMGEAVPAAHTAA